MTSKIGYESVLQFCYDQHKMIWYETTVTAAIKWSIVWPHYCQRNIILHLQWIDDFMKELPQFVGYIWVDLSDWLLHNTVQS